MPIPPTAIGMRANEGVHGGVEGVHVDVDPRAGHVSLFFQRLHSRVDVALNTGQVLGRQAGMRRSHLPDLRLHLLLLPVFVPVVRGVLGHLVHDAADVRLVHPVHPGLVVDERGGVLAMRVGRPRVPRSPGGRIREILQEPLILL
jgi:hypothetical protein